MKKKYEKVEIDVYIFEEEDIVTASGEVDGDETKYPIPGGWGE